MVIDLEIAIQDFIDSEFPEPEPIPEPVPVPPGNQIRFVSSPDNFERVGDFAFIGNDEHTQIYGVTPCPACQKEVTIGNDHLILIDNENFLSIDPAIKCNNCENGNFSIKKNNLEIMENQQNLEKTNS